jgi:excisionase family DNA binding protein
MRSHMEAIQPNGKGRYPPAIIEGLRSIRHSPRIGISLPMRAYSWGKAGAGSVRLDVLSRVCFGRPLPTRRRGEARMATQTTVMERTTEAIALSKIEAAQVLGVSLRTVDRLIALKQLPVRRLGRRVLIPRTALQDFLRRDHPTQAA